MSSRALVLFSGGQDSTTCLAWALERFSYVETIGFTYGQRHNVEMECRKNILQKISSLNANWAARLSEDHVVDAGVLSSLGATALTSETQIEIQKNGLPNTFVPGRNLVFFTLAAALAYRRNITELVGGMCETDYSGYPDCREKTLTSLQQSLSLGMDKGFTLHTPLMHISKSGIWGMAETLGGFTLLKLIVEDTHTCYLGVRGQQQAWGHGCGTCPACALRKNGFEEFKSRKAT